MPEPFGVVLRRLRQRAGLTQEQLAERAGLSVKAISALERGERRHPYPHTVRALAAALRASAQECAILERCVPRRRQRRESPRQDRPDGTLRPAGVLVAQLPADVEHFTGRERELATLDRLLVAMAGPTGSRGGRSTAVVISAVSGTAGVGKTALALRWAHRVRSEFPDGQLYVNLRGDPGAEAHAWTQLGIVYWKQSHYEHAAEHLEQALTLCGEIGDRSGAARALTHLGIVCWQQGHYRQAAEHLEQALTLTREIDNRDIEAFTLTTLGVVCWRQGRYRQAAEQLQQALTLFDEIGGDSVGVKPVRSTASASFADGRATTSRRSSTTTGPRQDCPSWCACGSR